MYKLHHRWPFETFTRCATTFQAHKLYMCVRWLRPAEHFLSHRSHRSKGSLTPAVASTNRCSVPRRSPLRPIDLALPGPKDAERIFLAVSNFQYLPIFRDPNSIRNNHTAYKYVANNFVRGGFCTDPVASSVYPRIVIPSS